MHQIALSCAICVFVSAAAAAIPEATGTPTGQAAAATPKGNPEARKLKNPVAATPDSITAGQQLYRKYCQFCHGPTGRGDGAQTPKDMKPANLTDEIWDRGASDGEIFTVIQEGAAPLFQMKGLKGKITEEATWNIVNYLRTLGTASKSH